ncbi:hypothetical protein [Microbacterium sp.]|uniref:hypothetical protein n=1 Tax=Microbacterium sp. TaxID=51671 RepID=UPI0035B2A4EC
MSDSLFDFDIDSPTVPSTQAVGPMTASQREIIRGLFSQLAISDARRQLEVVHELTGVRVSAVAEVDSRVANTLIAMLPGRIDRTGRENTGNSWDDREEDTWIDRL